MTFDTKDDRSFLPDYNFGGVSKRTRSGHILKNYTFYRTFNRDNLWNDPYHASNRTWKAFHEVSQRDRCKRAQSTDMESLKRDFMSGVRAVTRDRLNKRRTYNRQVATAPHLDRLPNLGHTRQDVCSGMTKPIGGNLDDLPKKALRNILTPAIERMDDEACIRLNERLLSERENAKFAKLTLQQRRNEIIEDRNRRHQTITALEKLSGIKPLARACSADGRNSVENSRITSLAVPRQQKSISPSLCLDGLELTHISHPNAIQHLH